MEFCQSEKVGSLNDILRDSHCNQIKCLKLKLLFPALIFDRITQL